MMHILGGFMDILALRSVGIRSKSLCEFWSGLGRGSGGPLGETKVQRCRVGGSGVRPVASQGHGLRQQPQRLPDLRADAVPPTPRKRGRGRSHLAQAPVTLEHEHWRHAGSGLR